MKLQRWFTLGVIAVACLALTACSNKKSAADGSAADGSAQTYAYDDQNNLNGGSGGMTGDGQRHVNSLQAPSNQVYYFDFDQSNFSDEDMNALKIQTAYIASHPAAHVRLEGHTDNRGSREYNVGLGWRRALAVKSVLLQNGVNASQIEVVSYDKERPAASGDNEQAWALNRRVELIYESK